MALFSLARKRAENIGFDQASKSRQAKAWLAGIAAGNHAAFEGLMGQYLPRVHATAWRILRDEAEAEDVAQETFLRFWREAPNLGDIPPEPWLIRVASNLAIDRWRKKKPELPEELPPVAAPGLGAEHELMRSQIAQDIDQALDQLPERQRLAMVLVHFEEMPQKQAAEVMEISVDALESLLARARRSLKQRLAKQAPDMLDEFNEVEA